MVRTKERRKTAFAVSLLCFCKSRVSYFTLNSVRACSRSEVRASSRFAHLFATFATTALKASG